MKWNKTSTIIAFSIFNVWVCAFNSFAQKWSGVNGNEWLAGKYSQPWVRIGVKSRGIHRVAIASLPSNFQSADKTKLQLWRRGKQVNIIKADNSEIIFYGITNDGSSDSLLYRPYNSRINPYFSLFSNESSYFLTIGSTNGLRAVVENSAINTSISATQYHNQVELRTFQTEYSHANYYPHRPAMNSFYEDGKAGSGTRLPIGVQASSPTYTANPASSAVPGTVASDFTFAPKNVFAGSTPKVKMLISGRYGNAQVQIKVGKTAASLRSVLTVPTRDFSPKEVTFDLVSQDYDANGGVFGFQSVTPASYFSVSYYTISYQQTIDVNNTNEFNIPSATSGSKSRIPIANPPANAQYYDISDSDAPRIIQGVASNLMVTRNGLPLKLLVTSTSQNVNVLASNITSVLFQNINPASHNYLIVASDNLAGSAQTFANYRQTESPGVKYSPLVIKIRDIYNQFNYGEPSPVAIRRFVDFMISDNNKSKYLLLLGKSVTRPGKTVTEMPNEVPTVGFPGSDLLLVDGLKGTPDDVPAIPVGRVSALSDAEVIGYLDKVKKYESQTNVSWRKNIMHISGGKATWEIDAFKDYLSYISDSVTSSPFNGNVIQKVKTQPNVLIEQVNISTELNGSGLGMISYYGHGATYNTDFNAGYVSDAAKGYNNTDNYPVMFYNGCGVSNVFSDLFGTSPNSSTSRPLSLDWLITPGKGAVAVFGNTWDSYVAASNEYLDRLYPIIFARSDGQRGTIGQILQSVALQTKLAKGYIYSSSNSPIASYYNSDRANVHQILLQGDPALKILLGQSLSSARLVNLDAKVVGTTTEITWDSPSHYDVSQFIVERSGNGRDFFDITSGLRILHPVINENIGNHFSFVDKHPMAGRNHYRLREVSAQGSRMTASNDEVLLSNVVTVDFEMKDFLLISPNPVVSSFDIEVVSSDSIEKWKIVDSYGRLIKEVVSDDSRVEVSELPAGEYIIQVFLTSGKKHSKKFLKY